MLGALNVCFLRLKKLRMEKCLPKGLMLSDLSCIFAMLVLAYMVGFTSANIVELFDSPSLGKCFFVRPYVFFCGCRPTEFVV